MNSPKEEEKKTYVAWKLTDLLRTSQFRKEEKNSWENSTFQIFFVSYKPFFSFMFDLKFENKHLWQIRYESYII